MTIKEIEMLLDIPRATVRFYEKEGLIDPSRGENGYRDYSEEDVTRLKQIIIFRKLGIAVADIADLLDGAGSVDEILTANMEKIKQQIAELNGAMNVCRTMRNDMIQIQTFETERYWNLIREEEKQGQKFFDVAKDVAKEVVEEEKKALAERFYSFKDAGICFAAVCIVSFLRDPSNISFLSVGKILLYFVTVAMLDFVVMIPIMIIRKKTDFAQKYPHLLAMLQLLIPFVIAIVLLGKTKVFM